MSIKLYGGNEYLTLNLWNFPAGERGLRIEELKKILRYGSFCVELNYESDQDILDMLMLVNACRSIYPKVKLWLRIPYMPYARQDRVTEPGTAFSLEVIVRLIESCNFFSVEITDPHSKVTSELFELYLPSKLHIVPQEIVMNDIIPMNKDSIAILVPDEGARWKASKVASELGIDSMLYAVKVRDPKTGKITKTELEEDPYLGYNRIIVVDDICDGGYTFIELAKVVRAAGFKGRLELYVTHGIFSKGKAALYEYYDVVECYNDMRKDK